jgi:hypothetical protein
MVQFGKRAVFVLAAAALIGAAGTAAAATMAAPQHGVLAQKEIMPGTQGDPAPQPVSTPHHHGGCHWGMGDQSMKYQ